VRFEGPGRVVLADYDDPVLAPTDVLLRTLYSGISAGTELTAYRGSNPYLNKRWEPGRRLFVEDDVSLEYPVDGWGYEEVGEVAQVGAGVTEVAEGDVVWGTWGHRSTHVMDEKAARRRVLPRDMDPIGGVFSQIGAIALNAILDANVHLGETVAVFGQGVPGLLATQLATLSGGRVVAVDRIPRRLALAEDLGAVRALDASEMDAAEAVKEMTGGRGADVSIELSGSYLALHEAIRATAYNARVVVSGFFQGDGRGLFLGEEFHHNRVQLVCSQISGVSPSLDHRWDEWRLKSTFMELVAQGRVRVAPLVSHVLPIEEAAAGFELLDRSAAETVQVVLRF
jgi:threonine dehydrogenase-like Zn-dependent dehydrogenase